MVGVWRPEWRPKERLDRLEYTVWKKERKAEITPFGDFFLLRIIGPLGGYHPPGPTKM